MPVKPPVTDEKEEKAKPSQRPAMAAEEENAVAALIDAPFKTRRETAVDPIPQQGPWNTDDLYRKRGDYSIYEEMMRDDQVSIAMQIKKDLIVGNGWEITPGDDEQDDICAELDKALRRDCCNLEDRLFEMMTAYQFGFSVTEKQFTLTPDGGLALKALKTRAPVSWLFHQDVFGNVVRYEQQGIDKTFENIPADALIHFVNDEEFGNPYGRSDLRVAHLAWFTKLQLVKFYAIYMEKAASPIPVGTYDTNLADEATKQKLFTTLKKFQASTAMVIPKGLTVEFLQAQPVGETYKMAIELFNMFIGRALNVPDLLGFQGPMISGGSFALGKEQILLFMRHINKRRRTIEGLVNKHLVAPILKWNVGDVEKPPRWRLLPINEEQAGEYAKLWLELVSKAGHVPCLEEINYFQRCIAFPETTEEEWEALKAEKEAKAAEEKDLALAKIAGSAGGAGKVPAGNKPNEKFSKAEEDANAPVPKSRGEAQYGQNEQVGEFHKKTNFPRIEKALDGAFRKFWTEAAPLVKAALDGYVSIVEQFGSNAAAFSSQALGIKEALKKHIFDTYQEGREIAQDEITRDQYAILPSDEFIGVVANEVDDYIRDWEYKVSQTARTQIVAAVKNGTPISEVAGVIHRDIHELTKVGMERYARTKFTEVMNAGRVAHFESTGIVAAYQWSSILDSRTSVYCRELHGKIFAAGTQPPIPGHFNCRSMLIPITRFEDWNADGKIDGEDIQAFIEKNKGKGF